MLDIGTVLCDMHDWGRGADQALARQNLTVDSSIRVRVPDQACAWQWIETMVRAYDPHFVYSNKYLIVVGREIYDNRPVIVAAWCYDGRQFGLMRLRELVTD